MTNFLRSLDHATHALVSNLPLLLSLIAGLWLIHGVNYLLKYRLNYLGILPRHPLGVIGIVFSPFLHGNLSHLVMNSIMLFVLSAMILVAGHELYFSVSASIILISGLLIWLFARPGLHIGASGLVMGYFGYILINSISHPSVMTIAIAVICIYYFSGMFANLFPQDKKVSWEGHVFGFIAGIVTSYLL
jgi:membrane associated rhomboid family serine protease